MSILGIGNPLLDISAEVPQDFLNKYELQTNTALLAEEKHAPIYDEIVSKYQVTYTAGGATQNSIRIAQWLLPANSTAYTGCVGDDKFAATLKQEAEKDGVKVQYLVDASQPTGRCAVLLNQKDRCLVTELGAANHFKLEHLTENSEMKATVDAAQIVYSAGFFLTVSPPSLMHLAEHCNQNNKLLCGNISAPFIAQFFSEPLMAAMPYYDYLFGNESEAEALGTKLGLTDLSIESIAEHLANYNKINSSRPRHVVITQGSKATVVAITGQKAQVFAVPALDASLIVDLNGAGDAFVGGFLSQLAQTKSLQSCVDAGHFAARTIIQTSGVVLANKPTQTEF